MSYENKNVTTNTDGTNTGIHKDNPTVPLHVGAATQLDSTLAVSGIQTNTSLSTFSKGIVVGENTDGGEVVGQLRRLGAVLQFYNGSTWDAVGAGGGSSDYSRRMKVIDIVDCTVAPPTEVTDDRYILDFTVGTVNAAWDGASKGDIVDFNGTSWDAASPIEGWIAYVDNQNKDALYVDDGTPTWELRNVAVTDHINLTNIGTNTHAQIDSHLASTANPHSVTKSQVSLGNVTDDAQLTRAASDFNGFASKGTPVAADIVLIEDSADSFNKKKITLTDLLGGGIGGSITDSQIAFGAATANEIEGSAEVTYDTTTGVLSLSKSQNSYTTLKVENTTDGTGAASRLSILGNGVGKDIQLIYFSDAFTGSEDKFAGYGTLTTGSTTTGMGFWSANASAIMRWNIGSDENVDEQMRLDQTRLQLKNNSIKIGTSTAGYVLHTAAGDGVGTWVDPNTLVDATIGGSISNNQVAYGAATPNEVEGTDDFNYDHDAHTFQVKNDAQGEFVKLQAKHENNDTIVGNGFSHAAVLQAAAEYSTTPGDTGFCSIVQYPFNYGIGGGEPRDLVRNHGVFEASGDGVIIAAVRQQTVGPQDGRFRGNKHIAFNLGALAYTSAQGSAYDANVIADIWSSGDSNYAFGLYMAENAQNRTKHNDTRLHMHHVLANDVMIRYSNKNSVGGGAPTVNPSATQGYKTGILADQSVVFHNYAASDMIWYSNNSEFMRYDQSDGRLELAASSIQIGASTAGYVLHTAAGDGVGSWVDPNTLINLTDNQIAYGNGSNNITSSTEWTYDDVAKTVKLEANHNGFTELQLKNTDTGVNARTGLGIVGDTADNYLSFQLPSANHTFVSIFSPYQEYGVIFSGPDNGGHAHLLLNPSGEFVWGIGASPIEYMKLDSTRLQLTNSSIKIGTSTAGNVLHTAAGDGVGTWVDPNTLVTANVSKVGTPIDNQIGVWTGDGTIEGDANLTWDGTDLLVSTTGDIILGTGEGGATPLGGLFRSSDAVGTDIAGSDLTIGAGAGTGAGDVGQIIFQTPRVLGTGSTVQTRTTIMTLDEDVVTVAGSVNASSVTASQDTSPSLKSEVTTSDTANQAVATLIKRTTSGDMAAGFGPMIGFAIEDSAATENTVAYIRVAREGDDTNAEIELDANNVRLNPATNYITLGILETESGGEELRKGWGTSTPASSTGWGKGSEFTDVTDGKLYINTGTEASVTWTVVGTQT